MEFDAAQALLDLHNNIREAGPRNLRTETQIDYTDDVVKTANLYMSCFLTSNVHVDPSPRYAETNMRYYINELSNLNKTNSAYTADATLATDDSNCYSDQHMSAGNNAVDSVTVEAQNKVPDCKLMRSLEMMLNKHLHEGFEVSPATDNIYDNNALPSKLNFKKPNITTRDMGIQTIENNQSYKIKIMESTIKHLSDRIKILETQINTTQFKSHVLKEENKQIYEDNKEELNSEVIPPEQIYSNKYCIKAKTSNDNKSLTQGIYPCENDEWRKENTSCKIINTVESNDLVPIGKGRALVSARILRHINWNSYTSATRKLLTAIFSRRVLATHSLTGKRSPAFPKKQPKKKLDVDLVQDIVQTVVDRCSVPENVVRTSITTKCADESKMYRARMLNRKHKYRKTKENLSSETSDSDDSLC